MFDYDKISKLCRSDSFSVVKGSDFLKRKYNNSDGTIPLYIFDIEDFSQVKTKLSQMFSENVSVIEFDNEKETQLKNLCSAKEIVVLTSDYVGRTRFGFGDLVEVIRRLRDEDGCPWDRAQTHESIRGNVIEEAYELTEAIDLKDKDKMLEEAGDVLLQGLFHSVIGESNGEFTTDDLISNLCYKLIFRHTHIFGKNVANNAEEALGFWEQAKAVEKGQKSVLDKIDSVPKTFPAMMKAYKIHKYTAKVGFDFETVDDAIKALYEEIEEVKTASKDEIEGEVGDVLMSAVNVARKLGVDPEVALSYSVEKFTRRFTYVVQCAERENVKIEDATLSQMEKWYQEYKTKYGKN